MAEDTLAPTLSNQYVSERLLAPFLRDNISVGITGSNKIFLQPIKEVAKTDKEYIFQFPQINDYVDLKNIQLYVKGTVMKYGEGNALIALEEGDEVILQNNALHSIFESVLLKVGVNQEKIYESMRPQKAFLRLLLESPKSINNSLSCQGFELDAFNDPNEFLNGSSRARWTKLSKPVEFLGPTFIDFFQTDGFLPPATPLQIVYRKNYDTSLVIRNIANSRDLRPTFEIDSIGLMIPCMTINPTLAPHIESLTDKAPARFQFDSIDIRQFIVEKGLKRKTFSRVYNGKIPQKILVGLYPENSLTGDYETPALRTANENITQLKLYLNGTLIREHNTEFDQGLYTRSYLDLLSWFKAFDGDFLISHENYFKGYRFLAFDLLDNCSNDSCADLLKSGFVDLEITIAKGAASSWTMLVYAISPDCLDLDKQKSARLTRSVL